MDLRHLEYVVAIVDHGGVGRAATALQVAQPSVSASVRRLERELGVALFDRVGRRLLPTQAGTTVVAHARPLLAGRERLLAELSVQQGLATGTLRLVALPTLVADPLNDLVVRFAERYPHVRVEVAHAADADELARRVGDGRSEVGLTDLAATGHALTHVPLVDQPVVAVLPPGTALGASGRPVRPPELARLRLVTMPRGTSTRALLENALRRHRVTPRIVVETGHREAIVPLVLAGVGSTILPEPLAEEARRGGAIVLPLQPPMHRPVGLVHRDGPLGPPARAFVALATDPAADTPEPAAAGPA